MRGKVTDQDLTDYALNELKPDERFYVESMLAVSEECRHDVYRMLDLSEMLKEGYEQDEIAKTILLKDDQRSKVLTVPRWHWRGFLRQAAAVAVLAAGTVYAMKQPGVWHEGRTVDMLANKGKEIVHDSKEFMVGVRDKGWASTIEEFNAWQKQKMETELQYISAPAAAICTPPILGMPMPEVGEM